MVEPYSLVEAQALVSDAKVRMRPYHEFWRTLELLVRTGAVTRVQRSDLAGTMLVGISDLGMRRLNLVLAHMQIVTASALARDPRHVVVPTSGGDDAEVNARVAESLIRYFWTRSNATEDCEAATRDMKRIGNGFVKVAWSRSMVETGKDEERVFSELLAAGEEERVRSAEEGRAPRSFDDLVSGLSLTEEIVEENEPFVSYVSPYSVFVPKDARRMWEARWVAQELRLPMDEVLANPHFSGAKAGDLIPASAGGTDYADEFNNTAMGSGSDALRYVNLIEFYDMRTRQLMVFQMGAKEPLFTGPLPYAHRYPPFVHFRGNEDSGLDFWSYGDVEVMAPLQVALNEVFGEQMANLRRVGNKFLAFKDTLSAEAVAALSSNQPDQVVFVDRTVAGADLASVIRPLERTGLPADVYNGIAKLEDALGQVIGLSDFQQGNVGLSHVSATGAAAVEGATTLRQSPSIAAVERACAQAGLLLLLLSQEFLDVERVIRIVGDSGTVSWGSVSVEDLRGEFRVEVLGGSTQAVNPATRRANAVEVFQQVVPTLATMGYDTDLLVRKCLRDMDLNPDVMLSRRPGAGAPGVAPDTSQGGGSPVMDALSAMGGPPVPAAESGDLAL